MERNVLDYEPPEALFVPDDNPLLFYRALAVYGCEALTVGEKYILRSTAGFLMKCADCCRAWIIRKSKLVGI